MTGHYRHYKRRNINGKAQQGQTCRNIALLRDTYLQSSKATFDNFYNFLQTLMSQHIVVLKEVAFRKQVTWL